MANFTMPNNIFSMKFAPESVPGLPDVGVPQGDEDSPRTPSRCLKVVMKNFQMTDLTALSNFCYMKDALK